MAADVIQYLLSMQDQYYAATIERVSFLIARENLYLKNEKL
jgi:hypothetical protein